MNTSANLKNLLDDALRQRDRALRRIRELEDLDILQYAEIKELQAQLAATRTHGQDLINASRDFERSLNVLYHTLPSGHVVELAIGRFAEDLAGNPGIGWVSPEEYQYLLEKNFRLLDQREKMIQALRFYADPVSWRNDTVDIGVGHQPIPNTSEVAGDGGRTAQAVLEELGEQSPLEGATVVWNSHESR